MAWNDIDLGAVSAYAVAVENGYKGTAEEWARDQADAAKNAQDARKAAEGAKASEEAAKNALDALLPKQESAIGAIGAEAAAQVGNVNAAGAVQVQAVRDAGKEQADGLAALGVIERGKVAAAGDEQVARVKQAGNAAAESVRQVGNEVRESIPQDYTETVKKVSQLSEEIGTKTNNLYYVEKPYSETGLNVPTAKGIYPNYDKIIRLETGKYTCLIKANVTVAGFDQSNTIKIRPFLLSESWSFVYGSDVKEINKSGSYEFVFACAVDVSTETGYRYGLYISEISTAVNIDYEFEIVGLFDGDTATRDIAYSVLRSNQETYYVNAFGGVLNVRAFGADNTGNTDCSRLFNTLIEVFADKDTTTIDGRDHDGVTLYLPNGKYRILDTVNLRSNVSIIGQNMNNTIILRNPGTLREGEDIRYKPVLQAKGRPTFGGNPLKIRGVCLRNVTLLTDYQCYAPFVDLECTQYTIMEDVTFEGKGTHLRLNEDFDSNYTNLHFSSSGLSSALDSQYDDPAAECFKYPSLEIVSEYDKTYGYSNTIRFIGCRFEEYRGPAVKMVGLNTNMCSFSQCKFESDKCITNHIYIGDRVGDVSFALCTFGIYDNLNDDVIKLDGTFRGAYFDGAFEVTDTTGALKQLMHSIVSANGFLSGNVFNIRMKGLTIADGGAEKALFGNGAYVTKSSDEQSSFYRWNDVNVTYDKYAAASSGVEDLHITNEDISAF